MKKIVIFFGFLILFSCGDDSFETTYGREDNISNNHFVSISDVQSIIQSKTFAKLLDKVKPPTLQKFSNNSNILEIVDLREYKDKNDLTAFYHLQLSDNSIILVAADDRSHTIMSIVTTEENENSLDNIPESFTYWLNEEIRAIEFARDNSLIPTSEINKEWDSYRLPHPPIEPDVCGGEYHQTKAPLLTTGWGQDEGYNDLTPMQNCTDYGNGRAPTGCVATAVAQVMKYFQHPPNYNWNAMPNNMGSAATAQLMLNVGSVAQMNYGCDGSGTKLYRLVKPNPYLNYNPFVDVFGYASALFGNYNHNTVVSELTLNKPVVVSGGEKEYWMGTIPYFADGHAWVIDGYMRGFACFYDNDGNVDGGYGYLLFHVNWGWNSRYNGYFGLNNFSANGNSYNYQNNMIYGIRK